MQDGDGGLRSAAQCLDLLETCWSLERARLLRDDDQSVSETESEPGPEREVPGGMGQRASSTSSLHVKPPVTTAPGRVSLTWALLKRQPSVHAAQPQRPVLPRRASPARSTTSRTCRATSQPSLLEPDETSKPATAAPQVARQRSSRSSQSSSSIKRFGYDIHDVDEFLSKVRNIMKPIDVNTLKEISQTNNNFPF